MDDQCIKFEPSTVLRHKQPHYNSPTFVHISVISVYALLQITSE